MRHFRILSLPLVLLLVSGASFAQAPTAPAAVALDGLHDGPHVLWEGHEAKVIRIADGKVDIQPLPKPYRLALPAGLGMFTLDPRAPEAPKATYPLPPRICAVSDIHGNFQGLRALLKAHGVIDAHGGWRYGKGHLVVVGDVADRGAQVTEAYWLLRALEVGARKAGGRVHVLMGNHEIMSMRGDLRYQNPKYQAIRQQVLPPDVPDFFAPATDLGRWLRVRPTMLRLGDILFTHGGPSPDLATRGLSLDQVNEAVQAALAGGKDHPEAKPMLGTTGPLWYRGLIPGADPKKLDASGEQVGTVLKAFGARAVVVGHSTLEQVSAFHGGRVFGIDAGLKDGHAGQVWIHEGGKSYRGLPNGTRQPLD